MIKKMKFLGVVVLIGLSTPINLIAQTSLQKVGVVTPTPTEVLDVSGTLRIRTLPNDGTANAINTTPSGGSAGSTNQTFTALGSLVNDPNYNIVGSTTMAGTLTNKNIPAGFSTKDTSIAPFVIRRYNVTDWPSGKNDVGMDTGMSTANWEAVMSNVGFTIPLVQAIQNVFNQSHLHSYGLRAGLTDKSVIGYENWRIMGDINGVQEASPWVDILFINKKVVFSPDNRSTYFPF